MAKNQGGDRGKAPNETGTQPRKRTKSPAPKPGKRGVTTGPKKMPRGTTTRSADK